MTDKTKVVWHHEVGLPMKVEHEIKTRLQRDLDHLADTERVEMVGHLLDLYAPPHYYWTRREEFSEGMGELNPQQREYFQERDKVFGKGGRVPILGSLVNRDYDIALRYQMRLAGFGETTFRIWTDWPERISVETSPPELFTHVNQDVIGHQGRLLSVSGSLEEIIPYIKRTVGRTEAYCKVELSPAVILYLNRVTQDGATSEVLPLFRESQS